MTVLRVALDPDDVTGSRSVLASVPGRFVVAGNGANVAVVSGRTAGWPESVARAVDRGVRAVVVVRPGPADPDRVRSLARAVAGQAVVAVDTPYASDRTWAAALPDIAADAARASIVDSVLSTMDRPPWNGLVDQLLVVRPLLGPDARARRLHRDEYGYLLAVDGSGPQVTLTGVTSGAGSASLALDVVAPARRWQVRFDDTAPARATEVTAHDESGTHTRPLVYESGRRMVWQRLHRALTGDGQVDVTLDHLADVLAFAHRVTR